MLIWFMFALVGVQFFAGKLYQCNDPAFPPGAPRQGSTTDGNVVVWPCDSTVHFNDTFGAVVPREWVNSPSNFDDIISAMVTLYVMATGEGWPTIMFRTADITAVDFQPKRDNQPWNTCVGPSLVFSASRDVRPLPVSTSDASGHRETTHRSLPPFLSLLKRTNAIALASLLRIPPPPPTTSSSSSSPPLPRQLLLCPLHLDHRVLLPRARHRRHFPKLY